MKTLIAVASLNSSSNWKSNLLTCSKLITEASSKHAKAIFFPEASDFISSGGDASELCSDEFLTEIEMLSRMHKIIVSIGIHRKSTVEGKLLNSHCLIYNGIITIYDKLHLFDIDLPNTKLMESRSTLRGSKLIPPVPTEIGKIGLGICYDLRFPEFSTLLQKMGSDLITYPSAFTVKTGNAHWHVLLRARAIETQSWVIGSAQHGRHNEKRQSYGHSLVVDPFGRVVLDAENRVGIDLVEIDLDLSSEIREQMPVLKHRREDIYNLNHITY